MYILAYKDGHDPAACLLKDGEVLAACEEERFTRQKHAPSVFPKQSIQFCLTQAGISENEVDHVVYARLKPLATAWRVGWYYLIHPPTSLIQMRYAAVHMKVQIVGSLKALLGRAGYQKIREIFPNFPKKIYSYEHHLCHAASAYYFSNFSDSLIITWDGKGEATSVFVAKGEGNKIRFIHRRGIFSSLGLLYSAATKYLGFTPNDGEYKVMGLAPYGNPDVDFSKILRPDARRGFWANPDFVLYPMAVKSFERVFGPRRKKDEPVGQEHKNFAASLQLALEESGLSAVREALRKNPSKNLCLAGGVALNVKLAKRIWDAEIVEGLFVQPAAGDDGLVLGAAAFLYTELTGKRVKPLTSLYFGPEYSASVGLAAIEAANLKYTKEENIINTAAELLSSGKVVGWFQGRMEFGPRALGNRSVLAHPGRAEMKDLVNEKIKFREAFRPFCPSIMAGYAQQYFSNYYPAPFMITSFAVSGEAVAKKIPAVVHVDGTVRPQAVEQSVNPRYYELLEAFRQRTGIPALLNTSMNIRGEPIVCSPQDAINFFLKTNVDALVIGDYLLRKSEQYPDDLQTLSIKELKTEY